MIDSHFLRDIVKNLLSFLGNYTKLYLNEKIPGGLFMPPLLKRFLQDKNYLLVLQNLMRENLKGIFSQQ